MGTERGSGITMALVLHVVTLLSLTSRGLSQSFVGYDTTDDYYYDTMDDHEPPVFTARPQAFVVEAGQSVVVPCDARNIGSNILVIKHRSRAGHERLVFVGREKVTRDRRVTLADHRLHIGPARPRDAGTFTCMFDLVPPVQVTHTLDVHHSPTVHALGRPEQHVARGESVTLTCQAQGNPPPAITWARQDVPTPVTINQGDSVTLEHVDRHSEGTYICTADNGIGEPSSAAVTVIVEYPPEISTEKAIVRTGEGDRVELACVVHGRPIPEVVWTRDGQHVGTDLMDTQLYLGNAQHHQHQHQYRHPHQQQQQASNATPRTTHRHTLAFKRVSEKDFGAYMCIAENSHGQTDATIQMTGLPSPPHITSSPNGGESDTYTLTWTTESFYPITEFILKYRKAQLGVWQTNHTMVMSGKWTTVTEKVPDSHHKTQPHDSRHTDPPAVTHDSSTAGGVVVGARDIQHAMTYQVQGLEVATDYAANVRVRNKYGWSAESDTFNFSTKKAMAVLQSSTSGDISGALRLLPTAALVVVAGVALL